jgi:hypothetical protein
VRAIESVPTGRKAGRADVPLDPVVIKRMTKVKPVKAAVPKKAK